MSGYRETKVDLGIIENEVYDNVPIAADFGELAAKGEQMKGLADSTEEQIKNVPVHGEDSQHTGHVELSRAMNSLGLQLRGTLENRTLKLRELSSELLLTADDFRTVEEKAAATLNGLLEGVA